MPLIPPDHIEDVVRLLLAGEVAAIPTDTVYGLAARVDDAEAIARLATLKGRDPQQPIAVLFDSLEAVAPLTDPPEVFHRLAAFWPGALTLIVPARPDAFVPLLVPRGAIGLRQPDDPLTRELLRRCGGLLAVTSANLHGQPAASTAAEVVAAFGADLPVLDGGPRGDAASTVIDLTEDPPRVLREGPLTAARLGLVP
ncbi:MAG TPA: L-threonylcarbamoyladenylate synthase [Dehalococcoidia bacterium]|nr:L-threonylcarbamoyladenylate synthase [Dehalococcoidia bacterium]